MTTTAQRRIAAYKGGSLDLSGCDLTGITLPTAIGGWLDLSGCDLTGVTLPATIGGSLYLSRCDLTGVTLPTTIIRSLYLKGCDLTGITLPATIGGSLNLSGCDLTSLPKGLPVSIGGSLDLSGSTGLTSLPEELTVGGTIYGADHLRITEAAMPEEQSPTKIGLLALDLGSDTHTASNTEKAFIYCADCTDRMDAKQHHLYRAAIAAVTNASKTQAVQPTSELVRVAVTYAQPPLVVNAFEMPTTAQALMSTKEPEWVPESHWDNHPTYDPEQWAEEVDAGDTRLGYVAWVNNQMENTE